MCCNIKSLALFMVSIRDALRPPAQASLSKRRVVAHETLVSTTPSAINCIFWCSLAARYSLITIDTPGSPSFLTLTQDFIRLAFWVSRQTPMIKSSSEVRNPSFVPFPACDIKMIHVMAAPRRKLLPQPCWVKQHEKSLLENATTKEVAAEEHNRLQQCRRDATEFGQGRTV